MEIMPARIAKTTSVTGQRSVTKFGFIENCRLALAYARRADGEQTEISTQDHKGRCNHVACPACGLSPLRQWITRHRVKGEVILDPVWCLLLTWPVVQIHSRSVDQIDQFLHAVAQLCDAFVQDGVGSISGYLGKVEFNPPPGGGFGVVQGHVHLAILPGRASKAYVVSLLAKLWMAKGGAAVIDDPTISRNGLRGAMAYLNKHPLDAFREPERQWLHKLLLNAVEMKRRRPASMHFIGGDALSSHGFQKIRARARYESIRNEMTLAEKVACPDREYERYCPFVRCVCLVRQCPACHACGDEVKRNGKSPQGLPRLRCLRKGCGKSWIDRPVMHWKSQLLRERNLDLRIRRSFRIFGTIEEVARHERASKHRVRQVVKPRNSRSQLNTNSIPSVSFPLNSITTYIQAEPTDLDIRRLVMRIQSINGQQHSIDADHADGS